jgi:hypothetical protein
MVDGSFPHRKTMAKLSAYSRDQSLLLHRLLFPPFHPLFQLQYQPMAMSSLRTSFEEALLLAEMEDLNVIDDSMRDVTTYNMVL